MEKEEIQSMFRLGADIQKMDKRDPNYLDMLMHYKAMTKDYLDTFVKDQKNKLDETNNIDWKDALTYIAQLFNSMDSFNDEPNHNAECERRRFIWKIISNDMINFHNLTDKANHTKES